MKNWKQLLPIKERTAIRNKLRAKALNEFGLRLEQHWHESENKSSKFIQRVEFTKEEAACFKSVEYCGITSKKGFIAADIKAVWNKILFENQKAKKQQLMQIFMQVYSCLRT